MTVCHHRNLALLPEKKDRVRCCHCHLTISADELGDGYCPECYEIDGRKRYDFEAVAAEKNGKVRYRCEECGAVIECE